MSSSEIRHCSLDLETWGTAPGCAVRSIGAVIFLPDADPPSGELGSAIKAGEFYCNITDESCREIGLVKDPQTVSWWAEQSQDAQEILLKDQVSLRQALWEFGAWYHRMGAQFLWGHGPHFDEAILHTAYSGCDITTPWQFWSVRDTRTIYDLTGVAPRRDVGLPHYALDDASNQAVAVIEGYMKIRAWKKGHEEWLKALL